MSNFKILGVNVNGTIKEYECNEKDCIVFDSGITSLQNSILVPKDGSYAVIFKGVDSDLPKEKFGYSVNGEVFYRDENKDDNQNKKQVIMKIIGENGVFTAAQFECKII